MGAYTCSNSSFGKELLTSVGLLVSARAREWTQEVSPGSSVSAFLVTDGRVAPSIEKAARSSGVVLVPIGAGKTHGLVELILRAFEHPGLEHH